MRAVLVASLLALGIGLAGTSPGSAMPASGASIADAASHNRVVDAAHWRRHHVHRHHHRWHHHHVRSHRHCWWHHHRLVCTGW